MLGGEVIEVVGGADGLAQGQVAGQHDVFAAKRQQQGALGGPGADPRDGGELGDDLLVGQRGQGVLVQPAVGQPLGQLAQRADLPPGQARGAEGAGVGGEQFGGGGEAAAEQVLMRARVRRVAATDSCWPVTWNSRAPNRSIGGSWASHARGSKSGRSSISRASTGSASRR